MRFSQDHPHVTPCTPRTEAFRGGADHSPGLGHLSSASRVLKERLSDQPSEVSPEPPTLGHPAAEAGVARPGVQTELLGSS